jgi:hypothetical protein
MARYRIYSVTMDGRIIAPPVATDCNDDRAAIECAAAISDSLSLEVWEGRRRVALLAPGAGERS